MFEEAVEPRLVEAVEAALGARLDQPTRLPSPNLVFRASVVGGKSVVVKHVTETKWNRRESRESDRLLNESCCLELLGGRVGPRVLAFDRANALLIIEHLGDQITLEEALLDPSTVGGRDLLAGAGEALARMHSAGLDREPEFTGLQLALGTVSPYSDSLADFRGGRRQSFEDSFAELEVGVHPRFWSEVETLEQEVHEDPSFRTLIHADAGPQNFLVGEETHMIDFEFGTYLHAGCDVGGARVGFPQTWDSRAVASGDAKLFEGAYRRVAVASFPQLEDEQTFNRFVLAGSAHWALNRWGVGWRGVVEQLSGGVPDSRREWPPSHHATLWDSFCSSAEEADVWGPVASTLRSGLAQMQRRWPELAPDEEYPALVT